MKLWEKRSIQGREISVGTCERRKSSRERERQHHSQSQRSDCYSTEIEKKRECTDFEEQGRTEGRIVWYSRTSTFKSEIRTFGTFPKFVSAGFWAVLCTEIKGTAGHEFQESLLKKEAVQQHLLLVFFFCLLHTFLCDLSDGFQHISTVNNSSLSPINFSWVLPHRGEGFALGLALNFSVFL